MTIPELVAARDYFERGNAILQLSGCVLAEDFSDLIQELKAVIIEQQCTME